MDPTKTVRQFLMQRIIEEGVAPYIEEIKRIAARGQIACVVFEIESNLKEALRAHGWEEGVNVFPAGEKLRNTLVGTDAISRQWFAAIPDADHVHIFLFAQKGTALLNWSPRRGYWTEPGSSDLERAQGPN